VEEANQVTRQLGKEWRELGDRSAAAAAATTTGGGAQEEGAPENAHERYTRRVVEGIEGYVAAVQAYVEGEELPSVLGCRSLSREHRIAQLPQGLWQEIGEAVKQRELQKQLENRRRSSRTRTAAAAADSKPTSGSEGDGGASQQGSGGGAAGRSPWMMPSFMLAKQEEAKLRAGPGGGSCKRCSKPAVLGNYGFCAAHRQPGNNCKGGGAAAAGQQKQKQAEPLAPAGDRAQDKAAAAAAAADTAPSAAAAAGSADGPTAAAAAAEEEAARAADLCRCTSGGGCTALAGRPSKGTTVGWCNTAKKWRARKPRSAPVVPKVGRAPKCPYVRVHGHFIPGYYDTMLEAEAAYVQAKAEFDAAQPASTA
jgi:colicin import membrane protein